MKTERQDISTSWNSTCYMMEILLEQKRVIGLYAADYATISTIQWTLIETMNTHLALFEQLNREISSSTASTADVIPSVMELKCLLNKTAASPWG